MKKEIGGYMELEHFTGPEYYPDLYKVNLGRTALLWLLESRGCRKLLLPYYLCDSVIEACQSLKIEIAFYHLDTMLNPLLDRPEGLQKDEWLLLVNYYGQLTDRHILRLKEQYERIIIDHTHAFFQKPLPGVDTLYSCRKFFGISDGAYLSTDAVLTADKPVDCSGGRMSHVLGRYETDAGTWYQQMLKNASTYHHMEIRQMSKLTANILRAIDYEYVKKRREENYRTLKELLPSANPFSKIVPIAPWAYPYYHPRGIELRKALASQKIFVPTNWANVLRNMPESSPEYQWAANILPLPCDQRYGPEDMTYMAEIIKSTGTEI